MTVEQCKTADLIPYARNSRTHSDEQVAQIAASIREFGFTNPVLIDGDGGIIAGHGRVMAARKLGMPDVPCIRLAHLTDTQKRAYIIADNKLALNAGWDEEMLKVEFAELDEMGFDLELTGFSLEDISPKNEEQDKAANGEDYQAVFEVSVTCDGELEQQRVYEMLTKQGYKCRVLSM